MDLVKKLSIFVLLPCVLIAVRNQKIQKPETDSPSLLEVEDPTPLPLPLGMLAGEDSHSDAGQNERLTSDFYRESCPSAEGIMRSTLKELYAVNISVAPQLLRLAFHDCFISGCDASLLLDSDGPIKSEKEATPNHSVKGFEHIDEIKLRLEIECPGTVSCSDIVAFAAREAVLLAGGKFYPVLTGRLDSKMSFPESALHGLPSPNLDISGALNAFSGKGFNAIETIALLGAHSTGEIHCNFMRSRLFSFNGTNAPDPTINSEFLEVLRSECSHLASTPPSVSPSPSTSQKSMPTESFENRGIRMDYEGPRKDFGGVYYRSLLKGKGLLLVDQQLTSREDTKALVESYATESSRFHRDFGRAMFKLTHLQGFNEGEVRLNCRKVN